MVLALIFNHSKSLHCPVPLCPLRMFAAAYHMSCFFCSSLFTDLLLWWMLLLSVSGYIAFVKLCISFLMNDSE